MNLKQLTTLLALVAVLGGIGLVIYKHNTGSWENAAAASGGKILNLPINDVAQIRVKQAINEVTLAKKNDLWTVRERADYPANFEQVSAILRQFWELKPVQDVKVGPSQFARLNLVEPMQSGTAGGTLVEFKDKDGKALTSILLGKTYLRNSGGGDENPGMPAGRYVMPEDGSKRVSLVAETFSELEPKPEQWLDRDFLHIEKVKSIALTGSSPAMTWKLTRAAENGDWKLADAKPGEQIDAAKTASFGNLFASPTFVDVLAPDAKPATTGLDKPSMATFETFDYFSYALKIGKLTGENYPMAISVNATFARERTPAKDEKSEEKKKLDEEFQTALKQHQDKLAREKKFEQRVYLIPKYNVEQLFKERGQLLAEKKPEPTPAPAPTPTLPQAGAAITTPPITAPPSGGPPPTEVVTPPIAAPTPSPSETRKP